MNYEIETIKEGLIVKNVKDFDLVHIFECGQCFRWLPDDMGGYRGIAFGRAVCVNYDKDSAKLYIRGADEDDFNNIWCDYFDLKTDYGAIKKEFSLKDKYLNASVNFGSGIRLLKQEPFETLISFIISFRLILYSFFSISFSNFSNSFSKVSLSKINSQSL